jgi:hypothetical protein
VESPLFRVSAALGIHLIVYCAIGAGLAFGLYALLQPSRTPQLRFAAAAAQPGRALHLGSAEVGLDWLTVWASTAADDEELRPRRFTALINGGSASDSLSGRARALSPCQPLIGAASKFTGVS